MVLEGNFPFQHSVEIDSACFSNSFWNEVVEPVFANDFVLTVSEDLGAFLVYLGDIFFIVNCHYYGIWHVKIQLSQVDFGWHDTPPLI